MSTGFEIPQDAEDAFYDAMEENNLDAMTAVWEESNDVVCVIPMIPARIGFNQVIEGWKPLIQGGVKIDVQIRHLHWIEMDDLAIHFVQEHISVMGQKQKQPPMYATNIYRKGDQGWQLLVHQNAPTPPPPGMMTPGMG